MNRKTSEDISFGKWLRQRRHILDLTQQEFANLVGCARITLRRIEMGGLKPSRELANILLEKVGIPELERPRWILFARGLAGAPDKPVSPSQPLEQRTNLPVAITSFIGRERDVLRIKQRLAEHRLVTLTGVGGIGKTRLSQQVASMLLENYPDGVWLVELASLSEPALVPETVAGIFGIRLQSDRPLIEVLLHVLRSKMTLLILDNCEHLLDACAQLSDKLLKNCPNLKILATGREALGIVGEALYQVPSLRTPDVERIDSLEKLGNYEALRLFKERAQLVRMDFALTLENIPSIVRICARLDGIPLAIELAAARVQTLSLAQIAAQLDSCFQLLTIKNSTGVPKHHSLQASMDWSWNLLTNAERIVLRRLSVFAGGFTFEAASRVCARNDIQVPTIMMQLVTKSLIVQDHASTLEQRYYLLETIRQYAHERLVEVGEGARIRTLHLEYYLDLLEQAEIDLTGPAQIEWHARLNEERDNIRAALKWADQTNVEAGLYLSGRLRIFWEDLDVREGAHWLSEFIRKPESHDFPQARAKALQTEGWLLLILQQFDLARSAAQECLDLYRAHNDKYGEVNALGVLAATSDIALARELLNQALALSQDIDYRWGQASILGEMGWLETNYQRRRSYRKEAIHLLWEVGDWRFLAKNLGHLAEIEMVHGDLEDARQALEDAVDVNRRVNNKALRGEFTGLAGRLAAITGDYARARVLIQEAEKTAEELGNRMSYLWLRTHLGYVAIVEGNLPEARNLFAETISSFQNDKSEIGVAFALEGMAGLFIALEKPERAVRLIGRADEIRVQVDDPRPKIEQADLDKVIAACRARLGPSGFSKAYEKGRRMSLEEAVGDALSEH